MRGVGHCNPLSVVTAFEDPTSLNTHRTSVRFVSICKVDEPSMGLAPQVVEEIFAIVKDLNSTENVSFLLAEQNTIIALKNSIYGYILESGLVVMNGSSEELSNNSDVKEFYLGIAGENRKSFKDAKHYRRRKRWLA